MKIVPKRRRKESKTDYKARKNMIKSGLARIVFRKTNKYVIGQIVESSNAQDKVLITVNSKSLMGYGWPENKKGSLKSLSASYLTGYLLGKNSSLKSDVIFDLGMIRTIPNSRAYSFLKGVVDSGVKIKHNKKIFPSDDKIKLKDYEEVFNKIIK